MTLGEGHPKDGQRLGHHFTTGTSNHSMTFQSKVSVKSICTLKTVCDPKGSSAMTKGMRKSMTL